MFQGSITALITPFRQGELDEKAFQNLVEWQIAQGTSGLVPCGTTGESPTLSHDEHQKVVSLCVEAAAGKVPVIAGTGSNSTEEAISLTRHAKKQGVDAVLLVTPYYNKPTQEGLFQHFKAIHDSVDIPIILYHIPGRSVVEIQVETVIRLAALPNIVGLKDACADLGRPARLVAELGDKFCLLSGEDMTAPAFLAQGGVGCISVTSNVAPRLCADMQEAWRVGDLARFAALRDQLTPLHHALFGETSPAPVKYAASLLGLSTDEVRLPLVAASATARKQVEAALVGAGLLSKQKLAI
ncbi:MAG: 4-hydroxy-tetrahydrodipicolinate synthase [Alphaproteobacteria bacterium]